MHDQLVQANLLRQALITQRLVRKTQNGTVGQPTEELEDKLLMEEDRDGEGMQFKVGDDFTLHLPNNQVAPSPVTPSMNYRPLLTALLGSVLGLGGIGVGFLAADFLKSQPVPAVVTPGDKDTNTRYKVILE